ncbi:unnamed protein product [Rhizoctonia solani]|uniref:Uncharacterized protein n=1 Tax=Rhizoctonia solani TaxID=456999 RepID=A0A8H3E7R2_9AGAM|nr:unnamed protein product [Rhizoctonia solani]
MSVSSLRSRIRPPRPSSFAAITKEVDPENDDLILNRKERLIPWSKSPFFDKLTIEYRQLKEERQQSHHHEETSTPISETYAGMLTADEFKGVDKSNDEERGERPPAWLDLFYDLAWASTFSNLTQNNAISEGKELLSYAAFFALVWWMWVSQVSYDIRFYSNDWVHRICVFLQLCVFGTLAAFTSKFDITAFLGSNNDDLAQRALDAFKGTSLAQQEANERAAQRIPEISFLGIALVVGASRVLLCIQYIRVWLYAHNKRDPGVLVKPLSMFISASLWFGSSAVLLTARHDNNAAHISKFIMWSVATVIEVASHYFSPPDGHLRSMGSLTARLATLVTIILGEGLNAITGTLRFAATSLRFNVLCVCTAIVVYLTFYLYFEGTRPRISKGRRSLWICLHLPYMICVILFLEGLKNNLLYTSLYTSISSTYSRFSSFLEEAVMSDNMVDTLNRNMVPLLAEKGLDWEDGWKQVMNAAIATTENTTTSNTIASQTAFVRELYRLLMNLTVKAVKSFESEDLSPEVELAVLQYLRNDSLVEIDITTGNPTMPEFDKILDLLLEPFAQSGRRVGAFAGGTLIFIALINVTQSWPKDRYAWGSAISRFLNGTLLLLLLVVNVGVDGYSYDLSTTPGAGIWYWLGSFWSLPIFAFSLLGQVIVDHVLLVLAVRSADRALEQKYEPSLLDSLRDSKDYVYDPPEPSEASFPSTPTAGPLGNPHSE